ncbi:MAG TPA: pyridoxal-phosphate dependent enzyme [Gemmatimonadaceae bacterium]
MVAAGCRHCREQGRLANLTVEIDLDSVRHDAMRGDGAVLDDGAASSFRDPSAPGLWRWGTLLPVAAEHRVSLGEGDTPLVKLERFGKRIGVPELYVKDESRNPTWSYKDRLCAVAVAKAAEAGAGVITVASTGNHGASTAAYAARAGLPCVVFTTASVPAVMKTLMQSYGAFVVALDRPTDRWALMSEVVNQRGWFPTSGFQFPPIGSNAYGIEGYKTISFETWRQLGRVPDWVAVPTCYGDGLMGVWKGWRELRDLGLTRTAPRMIAAEVYGSLEAAQQRELADPVEVEIGPSPAFSINTPVGTHQSLVALRQSQGLAVSTKNDDLLALQRELARTEGIYAEASSLVTLAAVRRLRAEGKLGGDDVAVAVLTSTGLKDPEATAATLPSVPLIEPELRQLARVLRETYQQELL